MVRLVKPRLPPPPPPHTCEKCTRYFLSKRDLEDRHKEIEERFGDNPGCGGWGWEPPCGGCVDCFHMMTQHWFDEERAKADRLQALGFEYANPALIDTQAMTRAGGGYSAFWPSHSKWECVQAMEVQIKVG